MIITINILYKKIDKLKAVCEKIIYLYFVELVCMYFLSILNIRGSKYLMNNYENIFYKNTLGLFMRKGICVSVYHT